MRLATRSNGGRRRTRKVVLVDESEIDLGAVVAVSVAATVCAASVLGAVELRGIPQIGAVVLGSDTYSVGIPGLLTGPILIAAVATVVQARPTLSPRPRRRAFALTAVAAVAALGVGLTIFL